MVWSTLEQSLEELTKFQMKKEVYITLCGHTLDLAAYDMVKQSKITRKSLDTIFEISKLVELSPKHDSRFKKLKQELAPHAFPQA